MSAPRIKDASFLQLHIEKLILAFGIFVFAIAVFLFVVGNPFAIELNNQSYDDPGDAVDVLVRADETLERGLQDPNPLPPIEEPQFRENFNDMVRQRIDSDKRLASLSNPGTTLKVLFPDIPEPSRYALVYPPVPKNISHVSGTDVLDKDFNPAATQRFFDLWGKDMEEPGDFTMFIAAGEFDIYEWVTRLQAEVETDEAIRIPAGIWLQRFGIAGTALIREEWDPAIGDWVDRKIVVPLPNQFRVLEDDVAPIDINEALADIANLREGQIELAQPDLPWLKGFVQAVAPGDQREGVGVDGFLLNLNNENLGPKEKEILKLEEKIRLLEDRRAKQAERRGNTGGIPGNRGRSGEFDAPGPRPGAGEQRDPIQRNIDNLRERIERLRPQAEREAENRRKLEEERRLREEERKRREALKAAQDRSVFGGADEPGLQAGIEGMDLKEGSTLRVWAADPSMQPGKTYRYKLVVSVINPLYAVPRLAPDQLQENQSRAALLPTEAEIEAMPWIGPIKVEPKSRFFFTSGRANTARVDIFRRFDGELLYQDYGGSPGDTIGSVIETEDEFGQKVEVDMSVGSIIVDIENHRDALSTGSINSLVYMKADGAIDGRIEALDKSNPDRKELLDEIENGAEKPLRPKPGAAQGGGGGPGFRNEFDENF